MVLPGSAGAGRMAPLVSTRVSARLKLYCVPGHEQQFTRKLDYCGNRPFRKLILAGYVLDGPGNASQFATWKPYVALFMRHCLDKSPKKACQIKFSKRPILVIMFTCLTVRARAGVAVRHRGRPTGALQPRRQPPRALLG